MADNRDNPERLARDYQGYIREMPRPSRSYTLRGTYEEGVIELWADRADFAVVYGLQIKSGLSYAEAAAELGQCLLHCAQCEGRLD